MVYIEDIPCYGKKNMKCDNKNDEKPIESRFKSTGPIFHSSNCNMVVIN